MTGARLSRNLVVAVLLSMVTALLPVSGASAAALISGKVISSSGTFLRGGSVDVVMYDEDDEPVFVDGGQINATDGSFSFYVEDTEAVQLVYNVRTQSQSRVETQTSYTEWTPVPTGGHITSEVPTVPLTVQLVDGDGSLNAEEVVLMLTCEQRDETGSRVRGSRSEWYGTTGDVELYGVTDLDEPCVLKVTYGDVVQYRKVLLTSGSNKVTMVLESVEVSGVVSLPGGSLDSGSVYVTDGETGQFLGDAAVDPATGRYRLRLPAGNHYFTVQGRSDGELMQLNRRVEVNSDATLDWEVAPTRPFTVNVVDGDGVPVSRKVELHCFDNDQDGSRDLFGNAVGSSVTLNGVPKELGWRCLLDVYHANGVHATRAFPLITATGDNHTTFYVDTGALIHGDPATAVDSDGVPAQTEALGLNSGDGNGDGEFDYRQPHVTSVPAYGASPTPDAPYLTIEAPAGTTLSQVTTLDPSELATPPPSDVYLYDGLVSFVVEGVEPGSDRTVSIYTYNASVATGYVKYNPTSKQWSLLPADRFQAFADRVSITLTDGGVGDADGVADGRIVDPGGPAVVTAGSDTTPPTVVGAPTSQPNPSGWYRDDIEIDWTATDETADVTDPPNTVITDEGDELAASSEPVCDDSGNCTTGTVSDIKIDRTAPTVNIGGVAAGATYVLGSAPAVNCTASDSLSGVAGTCITNKTGGNARGVGDFTATATATDNAGNTRTFTVGYRVVYRFDGFLQPINDSTLTPGISMSVFKAGSTIPVSFKLTRADGRAVTPLSAPKWLTVVRGAPINASINESSTSGPGTAGTSFIWKKDHWQYDWSTKRLAAGYRYTIQVGLDDGSTRTVTLALK